MLHTHPSRPVIAGLAILAIAISACGPATEQSASPTTTPAPSAAVASAAPAASAVVGAGGALTGHIQLPDKGFGLTLPDGWKSVPVDPAALQSVIDGLPADSDMRTVLEGQMGSQALQAIGFWAFDFDSPASGAAGTRNVNIIVQPPSTFDLTQIESAVKAQLGSISGIGTIESKVVTLPSGDALRLDYSLDVPSASGSTISVATTQYYAQLPKATLIISFTSEPGATDAQADFDAIMQSLESD